MSNKTHDYEKQADAYAELEMQGTQYLAFRDIPTLIRDYAGRSNPCSTTAAALVAPRAF